MPDINQKININEQQKSQFTVKSIPYHIHNGIDAPKTRFITQSDVPTSYTSNTGAKIPGYTVIVNPSSTGLTFSGGVLALTATNGFPVLPTCAGTPTGIPTGGTGSTVIDTTAGKLWTYYGGTWHFVTLT